MTIFHAVDTESCKIMGCFSKFFLCGVPQNKYGCHLRNDPACHQVGGL
ncbi:MAG: hypothetical protein ABIN67_16370 [Ferruginibacter sp.]